MGLFFVVAPSVGVAIDLYGANLIDAASALGLSGRFERKGNLTAVRIGDVFYLMLGSNDVRSVNAIGGREGIGVIIDEATNTFEAFHDYIPSRLSGCEDPLHVLAYNRVGTANWVRGLESDPRFRVIEFDVESNRANLPPGYIENVLMKLPPVQRARLFENRWHNDSGLVHPDWQMLGSAPAISHDRELTRTIWAWDPAQTGGQAALLLQRSRATKTAPWVVVDEFYHRGADKDGYVGYGDVLRGLARIWPQPEALIYDGAASGVAYECAKFGLQPWIPVKDVAVDIEAVNVLLTRRWLVVSPACENLVNQLQSVVYPTETPRQTTEITRPLLVGEHHATDALRYAGAWIEEIDNVGGLLWSRELRK